MVLRSYQWGGKVYPWRHTTNVTYVVLYHVTGRRK